MSLEGKSLNYVPKKAPTWLSLRLSDVVRRLLAPPLWVDGSPSDVLDPSRSLKVESRLEEPVANSGTFQPHISTNQRTPGARARESGE